MAKLYTTQAKRGDGKWIDWSESTDRELQIDYAIKDLGKKVPALTDAELEAMEEPLKSGETVTAGEWSFRVVDLGNVEDEDEDGEDE